MLLAAMRAGFQTRPRVHSAMTGSIFGVSGIMLAATLASLVAAVAFAFRKCPLTVTLITAVIALLWITAAVGRSVANQRASCPLVPINPPPWRPRSLSTTGLAWRTALPMNCGSIKRSKLLP